MDIRVKLQTSPSRRENDYEAFAWEFQLNRELVQQGEKLQAMKEWCEREGITQTPTVFINGYQLPEDYDVEDLKWILI